MKVKIPEVYEGKRIEITHKTGTELTAIWDKGNKRAIIWTRVPWCDEPEEKSDG